MRSDLVKVDVLGRPPVQASFDLGQREKRVKRPPGDTRGKARLLDEPDYVGVSANDDIVCDLHDGARRRDPTSEHRFSAKVPPVKRQPADEGQDLREVGTGIEQRPQCHVTGDAGEAMEPGKPL
jgi:hypothetical protein